MANGNINARIQAAPRASLDLVCIGFLRISSLDTNQLSVVDQLKRHQRATHKQESSAAFPSPSLDHFSLAPFAVV